jgi:UDP-glucuronate 4-epimerase
MRRLRVLVTGAAGFIGSHLCERLLKDGHEVIGMDAFIELTPRPFRTRNLELIRSHPRFVFLEKDLLTVEWKEVLPGIDVVYHLAGMPGVRSSWGAEFAAYIQHNIAATQRLLEGCKDHPVRQLIYASTSSVYGNKKGKVGEDSSLAPLSPYGVSKLTGEQLCRVYHYNEGVPIVILRFFTVYGPRQRPDMAFHRFIRNIIEGKPVPIYGSGKQTRDFTYVSDCVEAAVAVLKSTEVIGETINIGGKERASLRDVLEILEELFGHPIEFEYAGKPRGEPKHTWADISKGRQLLGYKPAVDLKTGLAREIDDLRGLFEPK